MLVEGVGSIILKWVRSCFIDGLASLTLCSVINSSCTLHTARTLKTRKRTWTRCARSTPSRVSTLVAELTRSRNDKFAMYLENQITRPECRGLNLEALLIKPVQVRLAPADRVSIIKAPDL